MRRRYILSPEAALDLVQIWRYVKKKAGREMADRVESAVRDKIVLIAATPGMGPWCEHVPDESVALVSVYAYLIVYPPEPRPLQVVTIFHGNRAVERLLKERL